MFNITKINKGRNGYKNDCYVLRLWGDNSTKVIKSVSMYTSDNPDEAIAMYEEKINNLSKKILKMNDKIRRYIKSQEFIREYKKDNE